jgi:hypothetical protein
LQLSQLTRRTTRSRLIPFQHQQRQELRLKNQYADEGDQWSVEIPGLEGKGLLDFFVLFCNISIDPRCQSRVTATTGSESRRQQFQPTCHGCES